MMKRLSLVLPMLLLLLGGCAGLLEPAAAVVGGDKITVDEVDQGLEHFTKTKEYEQLTAQGDPPAIERQFEQGFLSQLIRRAVLQPRAEELGIEVTDREVNDRLDRIKADFASDSAFQEALKEQGLDEETLIQLVHDSILEEELREEVTAEAEPTEVELRDYYKAHKKDYEQTRAQHVLVDNKNLATSVSEQAKAAPKNQADKVFSKLAKEFSTDTSNADQGGDLGFYLPGQFVPPFEEAAAKLDVGEVSGPVRTEFGWHVIRVTARRVQPFASVRDEIADQLSAATQDRVWSEWLIAAYEDAEVKVNPRYGEFDQESGQVVDASAEDIPGAEEPKPTPTPSVSLPGNP